MKTKPMAHQKIGCKRLAASSAFAMGAEQGTGKTWMLLCDAEDRFKRGEIDAVLVIAPKGVHTNWIVKEIPEHLSVKCTATLWLSGAGKKHQAILAKQLAQMAAQEGQRHLHVHAMNVDAVNTKAGMLHAKAFIKAAGQGVRLIAIVDESQTIKNPGAKRTQRIIELGRAASVRRIASGTLVADSPIDLFSQYDFLGDGLLGTRSFRAFVSEYADLVPVNSPLVQDIIARTGARGAPQIIAKNADGTKKFKNLDKLSKLMAPHTFRVTKKDCLDLPEKIYQTRYFEMEAEQRALYEHLKAERNWIRDDGTVDTFTAMTVLNKLRQITSGFILADGEPTELRNAAPRMEALTDAIEETRGPIIIFASFREELHQIVTMLVKEGERVVEYHGGTSPKDRTEAIRQFQSGAARFFVGNPAAAGTGITLTAAETAIYYSCDFSLINRVQSEDRCHRIGTKHHVVYIDIVARDSIDERIASALQTKKGVAEQIMTGL
jgi:SNF2 family DNA or RNA helicase